MATKRFTTSSHHDPTITQRTRTILLENGDIDVVLETVIDGMRDVEQMSRKGLKDHEDRLLLLESAERNRLTQTGVWTFVKAKLDGEKADWQKWAKRAALIGLGGALLKGLGFLIELALKGLHAQ